MLSRTKTATAAQLSLGELSPAAREFEARRVSEAGFIASEARFLGAELDAFYAEADAIKRGPLQEVTDRFHDLCRGFSIQMEFTQAGLLSEYEGSYRASKLHTLLSALRTYCEEGILGWRKEPIENIDFTKEILRREYSLSMDMDFGVPGGKGGVEGQQLLVKEFDPKRLTASSQLLERLEKICRDLVIDLAVRSPQEGFARAVTAEELAGDLETKTSRLFVPSTPDGAIGLYLIFCAAKDIPSYALSGIAQHSGADAGSQDGWTKIVGLSRQGRDSLRTQGISPYRVLNEAVAETARGLGLRRLWGEVRIGEQGNLAREKHVASGWLPTGIVNMHDGHPYELLVLHTYGKEHSRVEFERRSTGKFEALALLTKNFQHVSDLPLQDMEEIGERYKGRLDEIRQLIGGEANVEILLKGGKIEFVFRSGDSAFAIKQKAPQQDLWKIEDPVYYEIGINQPMVPLDEVIEDLRQHGPPSLWRV